MTRRSRPAARARIARAWAPHAPLAAALPLTLALALAACGTAPPTSAPASPPGSPPASAGTTQAPATDTPSGEPPITCAAGELVITSSGWGGAAGSRGADVRIENQGPAPCLLPPRPAIAIFDANGTLAVQSPPEVGGEPPLVGPGEQASFSFQLANWCDEQVALPVRVAVVLASEAAGIGGLPVDARDDLPPCNGPGQPPMLSTSAWQAP